MAAAKWQRSSTRSQGGGHQPLESQVTQTGSQASKITSTRSLGWVQAADIDHQGGQARAQRAGPESSRCASRPTFGEPRGSKSRSSQPTETT